MVKLATMDEATAPAAYRIHVWIQRINPMIWRQLVVPSGNILADLHYAIQIAFAWTDYHLHRFRIHGKEYGIPRCGGPWYSRDARGIPRIGKVVRLLQKVTMRPTYSSA